MVMRSTLRRAVDSPGADVALCLLVCLPVIFIFFAVSLYNHPLLDDFWCTSMVRKYGYWNAQVRLYDHVPPRYLALGISCLMPLSFGNFSGYKIIPVLFILLFVHVLTSFYRTLGGRSRLSYGKMILPAVLSAALYLSVIPGIAEGIYWTSSLCVYDTGILLFIIWCDYSLRWYYLQRKPLYLIVATLCLAGMLGCNEIISIIVMTVMAVTAGNHLWRKKGGGFDAMLVTQFVVLCLCLLFIFRFKGIGNRYSMMKNGASGRWLYSIGYSLIVDGYYIGKCLINPFFWAISIAWYRYGRKQAAGFFRGFPAHLAFRVSYVLTWAAILMIIPFVIIFITSDHPPIRICNLIVFFFLFGLPAPAVWLAARVKDRGYTAVAVLALAMTGFLLPNNVSLGARDLFSGGAAMYDRVWNSRYEMIRQCKEDSCVFPQLKLKKIPFVFRLGRDSTQPHLSEYFGKHIFIR